jgi:hypothetical protein
MDKSKKPLDFLGNELKVGQSIVYATASRDVAMMNSAVIEKIIENQNGWDRWVIKARRSSGKRLVTLRDLGRMVIVPFVLKMQTWDEINAMRRFEDLPSDFGVED